MPDPAGASARHRGGPPGWRPWRVAWQDALYGPDGFYRSVEGPAGHFGTSANQPGGVREVYAAAFLELAGRHGCTTVVDIGAGRGELLGALARAAGSAPLDLVGVDVVPEPPGLPAGTRWLQAPGGAVLPPELTGLRDALVVATEWLDVVPVDVLEVDPDGVPRVVEVDRSGAERLGAPPGEEQLAWCRAWWPLDGRPVGTRVEVGLSRDRAWADLVTRVDRGICVAVDYGHRRTGRPPHGSLAGHRAGRLVPPRPDGSCDLTAEVALDSLAAAPGDAGDPAGVLRTQAEALRALGVQATRPAPPDPVGGRAATAAYLRDLQRAAAAAELLDPGGLGGFGWLERPVAIGQPEPATARVVR